MAFKDELKYARELSSLSREDLAKRVGVAWQTIRSLEQGVRSEPRFFLGKRLEKVLSFSFTDEFNHCSSSDQEVSQ
jgi:DNA-binding XRE family transcriptional regulator